jgi:phage-related protein (TIGR01555 family)
MARKTARSRLVAHGLATRDSLSNFAASLNSGKDKAAGDAFFLACLPRDQIEAMYRGDWLARKVIDIVPYDSIREWREWRGDRPAVTAIERTERRLGLRKAVQRAMILGRLYGGGAIVIGTDEDDPASLARPLDPEAVGPDGIRFLHVVSRWQLGASEMVFDPLDPFYGEPSSYSLAAPLRGELTLHPSRVVRFLGNPLPDPAIAGTQLWSDSVLQTLYDAVHAVALTAAGATSLMHEAKVDIVTVPNLSEHLSNAATTAQLSARFSYAAAMKSINNLLLLGDGESWARQTVNFAGLPEMVRTFLQMAAGAADIPVTRLLGQSPAGMSATGDSDTRNYYDMIAARQELDLRPQLERLDALLLRSSGVDPDAVSFSFRPLWQLSAAEQAGVALQKAQASAVYAGLNLWPAAVTADLVRGQLLEDGTYPGAITAFEATPAGPVAAVDPDAVPSKIVDFDPDQPRDDRGQWTIRGAGRARAAAETTRVAPTRPASSSAASSASGPVGAALRMLNPVGSAAAQEGEPDEENRGLAEELLDPTAEVRVEQYARAMNVLRAIDPKSPELVTLTAPDYIPSNGDIERVQAASEAASIKRVRDFVMPGGVPIGQPGNKFEIRAIRGGGLQKAREAFDYLSAGGTTGPFAKAEITRLPCNAGFITLRPETSSPDSPAVDINVPDVPYTKLHF